MIQLNKKKETRTANIKLNIFINNINMNNISIKY